MHLMRNASVVSARRHESTQDRVNRRIYHAPGVARYYYLTTLDAAETAALLKYQPACAGRDVLDLGVGTGRTTSYLAPLSRRYVCVDASPVMVDHLRAQQPDLSIELADMRDLSRFDDVSFDFALASCNLLAAVSHEHRLQVLSEIHRVLRPPGLLMFSSHNRRLRRVLSGPRLVRPRHPGPQALHVVRYFRSLVNHARIGKLRRVEDTYALLNDPGHDYAMLHYYIDRAGQREQLDHAGFHQLDVFDASGRSLCDNDDDSESPSLLYVAERV